MAKQGGIGFFPTDVDMLDDDKVDAFCAYGRLMALLS